MWWSKRHLPPAAAHDCKRDIYLALKLMAGWDLPTTLYGQPVEVTVSWPNGYPFHFTTDTELRMWARRELLSLDGQP